MLSNYEQRTLDLANRLHDMTCAEWGRVKSLIDRKFEQKKNESERRLQLDQVVEEDLSI